MRQTRSNALWEAYGRRGSRAIGGGFPSGGLSWYSLWVRVYSEKVLSFTSPMLLASAHARGFASAVPGRYLLRTRPGVFYSKSKPFISKPTKSKPTST
jgi:hypothetical protein